MSHRAKLQTLLADRAAGKNVSAWEIDLAQKAADREEHGIMREMNDREQRRIEKEKQKLRAIEEERLREEEAISERVELDRRRVNRLLTQILACINLDEKPQPDVLQNLLLDTVRSKEFNAEYKVWLFEEVQARLSDYALDNPSILSIINEINELIDILVDKIKNLIAEQKKAETKQKEQDARDRAERIAAENSVKERKKLEIEQQLKSYPHLSPVEEGICKKCGYKGRMGATEVVYPPFVKWLIFLGGIPMILFLAVFELFVSEGVVAKVAWLMFLPIIATLLFMAKKYFKYKSAGYEHLLKESWQEMLKFKPLLLSGGHIFYKESCPSCAIRDSRGLTMENEKGPRS